jgi:hypothetical protein
MQPEIAKRGASIAVDGSSSSHAPTPGSSPFVALPDALHLALLSFLSTQECTSVAAAAPALLRPYAARFQSLRLRVVRAGAFPALEGLRLRCETYGLEILVDALAASPCASTLQF